MAEGFAGLPEHLQPSNLPRRQPSEDGFRVFALEAELRAAYEWAKVMEHERDFEVQVVSADLQRRLDDATAEIRERQRLTTRMLQALDAYWLGYEGLPTNRNPRGRFDSEDWWFRYERYRTELLALATEAGNPLTPSSVSDRSGVVCRPTEGKQE